MGKSKFDLVDKTSSGSDTGNWIYSQMIKLDPPNFFGKE